MPGRAAHPPVSQQQRRAMYAAKEGKSYLGIPKSVGAEKVEAGHDVTGLPRKVRGGKPVKMRARATRA
jgi:hypothetical protein